MPTPSDPQKKEQPSTYFVQDRANKDEHTRLHIQDQMLTIGMGGALPEQPNPTSFQSVLDSGCGTGNWLIEIAKTYPTITRLVGVDISHKVLEYARLQAKLQQVSDRVEFHMMDALRKLSFPDGTFDLVNHRLGVSYLRTWDWPELLAEYQRVCKPGGVIRITECDTFVESTSPAQARLYQLFIQSLCEAGHLFHQKSDGLIQELPHLLSRYGLRHVQTRTHVLSYRAGTPEGQHLMEDLRLFFRTLLPFFRKWIRLPDDYEATYQQMLKEMQMPNYTASWTLLTAWGIKPGPSLQ